MIEEMIVIPALNVASREEAAKQIRIAELFFAPEGSQWLHLDVADGIFAPATTWAEPHEWRILNVPFNLEVHLMVQNAVAWAERWLSVGAKRIIVHHSSITNLLKLRERIHAAGAELLLAITLRDDEESFCATAKHADGILVLAVPPGYAGQQFDERALALISRLKARFSHGILMVDGGVDVAVAHRIKAAGADAVVSASFLFESSDPRNAFRTLSLI